MKETFPTKSAGDNLSARHINSLSAIARRFVNTGPGSGLYGVQGGVFSANGGSQALQQFLVEVTDETIDANDTNDSGFYKCKIKYYNNAEWKRNDTKEWELDATATGNVLTVGDVLTAWWNQQRGMLVPTSVPPQRFELKDDLTPGGQATAYHLIKGNQTDDQREFEVYDPFGVWRGRRRDKFESPNDSGSKGTAIWNPADGRWEIVLLQPAATRITGKTTAAVVSTDATFRLFGVYVMSPPGGLMWDQDMGRKVTVQNAFSWDIDSGTRVDAVWNELTRKWDAAQATCPA